MATVHTQVTSSLISQNSFISWTLLNMAYYIIIEYEHVEAHISLHNNML